MRKLITAMCALPLLGFGAMQFFPSPEPDTAKITELSTIDPSDICKAEHKPAVQVDQTAGIDDDLPVGITITPAFRLIDQHGSRHSPQTLFGGKLSLVFFGYASCEGVCLLAIPSIAEAAAIINSRQNHVQAQPVLITIDPERDTPAFLKSQLAQFSDQFLGLTGPEPALENVRKMFNVQSTPAFEDAKGTVFQHGSFIFVIDSQQNAVSMLPPVLPPEQIAQIAMKYL